jgi:histidinol-phosphate aminotransferase
MVSFIRPEIHAMSGYTPGEQPRDGEYLKLNTNENPYPPSPKVFEAIQRALTSDGLRKYPDPLGHEFRATAGRVLKVEPACILIGNGSDDVLTILTRTFVPAGGLIVSPTPSYLLYKTLAEIQGARYQAIPFSQHWGIDPAQSPIDASLTFIPNPNSPTGTTMPAEALGRWPGPLVIDEAYADFADHNALHLVKESERFVVTRSLSKSYSLAGVRFGFAVAAPEVTAELYKVKDSYNCDVLSLVAATAAIADQAHMLANRAKIIATRTRLAKALRGLGFEVCDSQANFVWARHPDRRLKLIYEELRRRKILVRYMSYEGYGEGLRISVGTDTEIDHLVAELMSVV